MNPLQFLIALLILSAPREFIARLRRDVDECRWLALIFTEVSGQEGLSNFDQYVSWWAWCDYLLEERIKDAYARFICWRVGHDFDEPMESDAENGTEDGYCSRCGFHHHAQF